VGLRRPTLDDVFLTLTGHAAETSETDSETPSGGTNKRGDGRRNRRRRVKEPV
jgi:ABC-2 type transport system ATP-binding protein